MNKKELFDWIQNEKFKGLEDYHPIMVHILGLSSLPSPVHSLVKMIYSAVGVKYELHKNSEHATQLFLFSSSYMTRNDYRAGFQALTDLIEDAVTIRAEKKWHLSVPALRRLFRTFSWYGKLKGCTLQQKLFIVSQLYEGYNSLCVIQKLLQKEKITSCTTFCDTHLVDSLVTEYFNRKGITTITLQHGHFADVPEIDEYSTRIHFTECRSDYMLTFGEYTNEQGVRCGMDRSRLKAMGMLKHIGKEAPNVFQSKKTNVFGVILSFDKERKANIATLKIANEFSKRTGMKYIARLHPSSKESDYLEYVDNQCGSIPKLSMDDFLDKTEFVTIGKSTMFIEMMYILKPAFIYASEPAEDSFPGIDWCKFSDAEGLYSIYKDVLSDSEKLESMILETREQLCCTKNVAQNYIDFYKMELNQ